MIELKIHTNIKPFLQEGGAPTKRISPRNSTSKASLGWAPTKRISPRNSTSKASWGRPQQKNFNVNSTSLTPLLD